MLSIIQELRNISKGWNFDVKAGKLKHKSDIYLTHFQRHVTNNNLPY